MIRFLRPGGVTIESVDDPDAAWRLPADAVWMAVRDVEIVDGRVLKERDNVRALLNSGQVGAARALKDRNARHNLGTIVRNFNEPKIGRAHV